jgi:hypothetical protein
MRKSWLLCALMGALAWGQAQPENKPADASPAPPPSSVPQNPAMPPGAAAKPPAEPELPETAIVLTIKGVCSPAVKAAAAKPASGKTATTAAAKTADCKTELTRAQFEKIAKAVSPTITPQLKRQLESALPRFMAMSQAATAKGLEKTEQFQELMKIVRMQVLTQELQRSVQEQAEKITPEDVDTYYQKNQEAYQQFSLDRLFIPRLKQATPASDEKDLTEEQRKAKEAEDKAKQEQGQQELNKLAEDLRVRAAAGEDFAKLQKEAFEAAGEKVDNPTVNLPKVRRTGLPPAHAAVFDLKVGEVSQVISDNGGHYVYKVVSKEVLPLDQVKDEIHNKLKSERMKELMDKYTNSFEAVPNEAYFGPPTAPGAMRGAPPPRMHPPMPPQRPPQDSGPPPAANPPTTPPAQAPPSNPN